MIISQKNARLCRSDCLASECENQLVATKGTGNPLGLAGLAIALGVGAAAFAGGGVAWADTGSTDSTASTTQRSDRNGNSPASNASTGGRDSATRARIAAELGLTDSPARFKPQLPHGGGARQMPTAASTQASKKSGAATVGPIRGLVDRALQNSVNIAPQPTAAQVGSAELTTAPAGDGGPADVQSGLRPAASGIAPVGTSLAPTARSLTSNSTASADILSRVISALSGRTPNGPMGDSPAMWTLLAAVRRELSPTSASAVAADPVGPTLVVGDYDLVATTALDVVSFYGAPVRFPAAPGTVQGVQNFDIKDSSGTKIGSVVALVDNTNSDSSYGGVYNEILVTDATYDSAEAAPLPVGSIVVNYDLNGFGYKYSSIPTGSGTDAVSFAWVTPFGDVSIGHRIFELFNASEYLDDNTLTSNVPVGLANGYYISAASPGTEDITAIGGVIPLFNSIQGEDIFAVYQDGTDTQVDGTFTGFVTTTKDLVGGYTELIIVTDTNGSTNVGTDPGQIPPVGSVLNVFHAWNLKTYVIYAAMPTESGTDMYVAVATPWFNLNLPQKLVRLDATLPLSTALLPLNDGNSLEAISPLQVSGGNGLPPREMIYQGYQQFLYKDANGIPIESFDADVSSQTSPNGDSNVSILVTKVNASTGDPVLPVGSVINITNSVIPGFGTYYSSVPTDSGSVVTSQYVTPWGRIPKFTRYDASDGLTGYTYYTPF